MVMAYILLAIITASVLSAVLCLVARDVRRGWGDCVLGLGIVGVAASLITAVTYAFVVWSWVAADHKARVINREYGTNYTREEVFFASDVIETIRRIDRNHYEIGGGAPGDKTPGVLIVKGK